MENASTSTVAAADEATLTATHTADELVKEFVDDELLVEEISIDGMCGVY